MDVDVLPVFLSVSSLLQRVLPRALHGARSEGSKLGTQLQNVGQAKGALPGRPATLTSPLHPAAPHASARGLILGVASGEVGARRELAMNTYNRSTDALRRGDQALSGKILATGLAVFFPVRAAADTAALPEALHAGWQANFGRGVTALIDRVHDQLWRLNSDVGTDVVHGDSTRDALLESIRNDGGITVAYRHAITKAAGLNNEGRHEEALAALRAVPLHQDMMTYFAAPAGTPVSQVAERTLNAAHNEFHKFQARVNGNDDLTHDSLDRQVSYARENPDALRMRGLVQSLGEDLFRSGAYEGVLDTVRPPVPPRLVAGSVSKD